MNATSSQVNSLSREVRGCQFIKKDGSKCKARALKDGEFCFFHANAERVQLAGRKGGLQGKRKVLEKSNIKLRDAYDVVALLEKCINEMRTGLLDRAIGNTLGYLAGILLKAFEQSDLERRVTELEEVLKNR